MKAGDKVWVPATASIVFPSGDVWFTDRGGFNIQRVEQSIPHTDALPAVARWLAQHGDALTCLEFIAGVATSAITSRCIQARARGEVTPTGEEARAQDVMDALLAALTTEETA